MYLHTFVLLLRKVSRTNYVIKDIDIVIYTIYFYSITSICRFVIAVVFYYMIGLITRNYHFQMISGCVSDSSSNSTCVLPI